MPATYRQPRSRQWCIWFDSAPTPISFVEALFRAKPATYIAHMSNTLWIGQRFLLNERGHYTVTGNSGTERVLVEIDPSIVADQGDMAERHLMNLRPKILAAARRKWAAGESRPQYFSHSDRLQHQLIALTVEDLFSDRADHLG